MYLKYNRPFAQIAARLFHSQLFTSILTDHGNRTPRPTFRAGKWGKETSGKLLLHAGVAGEKKGGRVDGDLPTGAAKAATERRPEGTLPGPVT